jgi:hypothetical protein
MHLSARPPQNDAGSPRPPFVPASPRKTHDAATLTLDMGGTITTAAGEVEQFSGHSGAQLVGRPVREVLPALAFGSAIPRFNAAYAHFWFANGRWRWVNAFHANGERHTVNISVKVMGTPQPRTMLVLLHKAAGRRSLACKPA